MLISATQHAANQQNARLSTGPRTPAGKTAVRLNALKYGLRARDLLLPGEDPAEYQQLWDDLESDWQPQNRTERLHLEQMATSQWLLARMARGERLIYEADLPLEKQLALLREVSTQRTRLERSFASAMHALEQLQKAPKSRPKEKPAPHVSSPDEHNTYRMSAPLADQTVLCTPAAADTR
ncbi:MAG TPA: hypothetical protein VMR62_24690 [Bryobacteraceae bacterium]|jgi:hypothetical protein|nr:hypothetical protein [Bryobacteraceae bacterium]